MSIYFDGIDELVYKLRPFRIPERVARSYYPDDKTREARRLMVKALQNRDEEWGRIVDALMSEINNLNIQKNRHGE